MKIPKPATTAIICGIAVIVLLGGYAAIRGAMNATMSSAGAPTTVTVYQTPTIATSPTATATVTVQPPIFLKVTNWANSSADEPGPESLTADQAAQVVAHAAQDIFGVDATGSDVGMIYMASVASAYTIGDDGSYDPSVSFQNQTLSVNTMTHSTWSASFTTPGGQAITARIDSVTGAIYAMAKDNPAGLTWTCSGKQLAAASPASQQAASDFVTTKLAPASWVVSTSTLCTTKSGAAKVEVSMSDGSAYLVSVNGKHNVYGFEYFDNFAVIDAND